MKIVPECNDEGLYQDIFVEAPFACFSIGIDGRVLAANRQALGLLGYKQSEVLGWPVLDLYSDTPTGKVKAEERSWTSSSAPIGCSFGVRRKSTPPFARAIRPSRLTLTPRITLRMPHPRFRSLRTPVRSVPPAFLGALEIRSFRCRSYGADILPQLAYLLQQRLQSLRVGCRQVAS